MDVVPPREFLELPDLLIVVLLLLLVFYLQQFQVVCPDLDGVIDIRVLLLHRQYLLLLVVSQVCKLALILALELLLLIFDLLLLVEDLLLRIALLFSVAFLEGAFEALPGLDVVLFNLLLGVRRADEVGDVLRQTFLGHSLLALALGVIWVDARGTQLLLNLVLPVLL